MTLQPVPPLEAYEELYGAARPPSEPTSAPSIVIRRAADVAASLPRASWVLRPYLEHNAIAVLYGDYGTYKSFVGVDWAMRIALGMPAMGHHWPARPAPVVLISAEGRGLPARLRGWCIRNRPGEPWQDVLEEAQLYCIEHPVNLSEPDNALALAGQIAELGITPAAVQIDTMSRNSDGRIENSTADAGAYLNVIDQHIRSRYQCAVVLMHHVGHAEKGRIRGPIVLAANTDALIRIERPDPQTRNAILTVERLKDSEPPPPQGVQADIVELGEQDEDGMDITTLALSQADVPVAPSTPSQPRGKAQRQLLAALRADEGIVWTIGEIRELGRRAGMHKSTARDAAEALTFSPYLECTIGGWRLAEERIGDETAGRKGRNGDERDVPDER